MQVTQGRAGRRSRNSGEGKSEASAQTAKGTVRLSATPNQAVSAKAAATAMTPKAAHCKGPAAGRKTFAAKKQAASAAARPARNPATGLRSFQGNAGPARK